MRIGLRSVSAKAIYLVIGLIILSVACSTLFLLRHFHKILGPDRLQQNLVAAEQIINPDQKPYRIVGGKLYAGSRLLSGNEKSIAEVTKAFGGVVTIFQGTTRVATNIVDKNGHRALGSRMADGPVYQALFRQGKSYVGEAQILGTRYVTAYAPLKNASGQVVGALFVGFDAARFNRSFASATKVALGAGLGMILVGVLIGAFGFGRLLAPFRGLSEVMADIKAGRYSSDVPYVSRRDEFGAMARLIRDFNLSMQKKLADDAAALKAKAEAEVRMQQEAAEAQRQNEQLVVSTFGAGLEALADGDLSYRLEGALPAAYRGLQENFNSAIARFEASQKAQIEAERKMAEERAAAAQQQVRLAEEAQNTAMETVVSSFGAGLKALAKKDLSVRVKAELPSGYDQLKQDFNSSLEILSGAMADIEGRAADIASNTNQLSQATHEMAQRTERQAASLEETAAAMEEVSSNVKKSAENAYEASQSASDAHKGAEEGNAVAKDTIAAMRNIAKSSREITQIIGVIDDIAFQTNLLALNAGVEAARAGDAGRGFAVVASEVRGLAQRSAGAAKQIKGLIHTSEHQVDVGVKLVEKSGDALNGIVEDLSRINILMTEIATAQQEQANAFSEINSAISSMDQTTQENAAMNEESTAASSAIASHARELADLIDSFATGRRASDRLVAGKTDDAAEGLSMAAE